MTFSYGVRILLANFALELNFFFMEINASLIRDQKVDVSKIQYINSIGAIIGDNLLLYSPSRLLIDLDSIRKAEIHKTRNFFYNLFFIVCSTPLFYLLATRQVTRLETILICVLAGVLLVPAFTIKNTKYKMLINRQNAQFIEIDINRQAKEDAKGIVRLVNKRIRQRRKQ